MPRLPDWFPPHFGIRPSVGERYHKDRAKTTLRQDRQGVEDRFETWSAKIFYAELLRQRVQERQVHLRAAKDHEETMSFVRSLMAQLRDCIKELAIARAVKEETERRQE